MKRSYELYNHAGEVPYQDWADAGVRAVIFDKDSTLTHHNQGRFVDTVLSELRQQDLSSIFDRLAIVSNNHNPREVQALASLLESELGLGVLAVSRGQLDEAGNPMPKKPHPAMGEYVARQFSLSPDQLGVVGDRLITDKGFGVRLGAAKIALCQKVGEGDPRFVPTIRRIEQAWIERDRRRGIAA